MTKQELKKTNTIKFGEEILPVEKYVDDIKRKFYFLQWGCPGYREDYGEVATVVDGDLDHTVWIHYKQIQKYE